MKLSYRNYVLGVLLLAYIFNAMDRAILSVLLSSIKQEFGASDTELGLLGGIAFAFFYATAGIPIAAWADRANRRDILSLCIAAWSFMTALCGMATNFVTLLLARIGTAIGEAGGGPTSQSLISDYFRLRDRATALSIYALGVPLGAMLGNFGGGWLDQLYGWRAAFIIVGLPGVLVAILTRLTVREPRRGAADESTAELNPTALPLPQVVSYLWSLRSFRNLALAAALHAFVLYGANLFNPSFLMRLHGMSSGHAGTWMAVFSLISTIGTFAGGYLADRLSVRLSDRRWYLWLPGIATILSVPFQCVGYLAPSLFIAIPCFIVMAVLGAAYFGPSYAMTQALAPLRMRAVAVSLLLFVQTLIGLGLGPLFVGILSDLLAPTHGVNSLAWGLVAVAAFNVWATVHYFRGARTLREDLARTLRRERGGTTPV